MNSVRSLEELRLSCGFSLNQVPCGRNHLIEVEHGLKRPGPALIRKLAQVYCCTTEVIWSAWEETRRRQMSGGDVRSPTGPHPIITGAVPREV